MARTTSPLQWQPPSLPPQKCLPQPFFSFNPIDPHRQNKKQMKKIYRNGAGSCLHIVKCEKAPPAVALISISYYTVIQRQPTFIFPFFSIVDDVAPFGSHGPDGSAISPGSNFFDRGSGVIRSEYTLADIRFH